MTNKNGKKGWTLSCLGINFLLFCIFFNPLVADEKIPIDNLYESQDIAPIILNKKNYSEFYYWYKERYGVKPKFVYRYKGKIVNLIKKSQIPAVHSAFGKNHFKILNYAPFRYYDTTYKSRYSKGYEELKDVFMGYKDYKLNEIYLRGIAKEYSDLVSYFVLGKTHEGRDIPAIRISINNLEESKASILFNCAHHSNELVSTEHCYDIIKTIVTNSDEFSDILENVNIWVVPIVNPDGSYLFWYKSTLMGRKNGFLYPEQSPDFTGRGVDLNRNYPFKWNSGHPTASSSKKEHPFYRGDGPGSEPETQAMMSLAETERFVMSMSFHTYATRILYPYTIENVYNPKPDYPKLLTKKLVTYAKSYNPNRIYEAVKNIYPVDGTDQDYYYFKYGTIALLAESSHKNIPYDKVHFILDGFRPAWKKFLFEYQNGYKLILRIVDEDDNPVKSIVSVEEFIYNEGEQFTNNPLSGYYHKLFPDDSEYTVKIMADGYETEMFKFNPYTEFKTVNVVMKKK